MYGPVLIGMDTSHGIKHFLDKLLGGQTVVPNGTLTTTQFATIYVSYHSSIDNQAIGLVISECCLISHQYRLVACVTEVLRSCN